MEIQGIVKSVEHIQKNTRLKRKIRIYFDKNRYISFSYNGKLKLSEIIKHGVKFKAMAIKNYENTALELKIGGYHILKLDSEINSFNHKIYVQIIIFSFIPFVILIGNIFIYYYKWNPMNIVNHAYFRRILYLIGLFGVVKIFLLFSFGA